MQYFKLGMQLEDIKKLYRELAKTYHPDLNPHSKDECNRIMVDINAEYKIAVEKAYRLQSGDNYSRKEEEAHLDIADVLLEIAALPGIVIEVCGTWVWVSGNTKDVKDYLSAAGFKYSGAKKMWYYMPGGFVGKRKVRGFYNIDQIRAKYGSQSVDTNRASSKRLG